MLMKHLFIRIVIFLLCAAKLSALAIETSKNHVCGGNITCYMDMGYSDLFLGEFDHIFDEEELYSNSTLSIQTNTSFGVRIECQQSLVIKAKTGIILKGFSFGFSCFNLKLEDTPEIELIHLKFNTTSFSDSIVSVSNFTRLVVERVIFEDKRIHSDSPILKGGCLSIENGVNVSISNSLFNNTRVNAIMQCLGGVVYVDNVGELTITDTAFKDTDVVARGTKGGSLFIGEDVQQVSLLNVLVSSSEVQNNLNPSDEGCGVYLATNSNISSCVFADNDCKRHEFNDTVGHALFVANNKTAYITNSIFKNKGNNTDFACGGVDCSNQLSNECTVKDNQLVSCAQCSNSICCGDTSNVPVDLDLEFASICSKIIATPPPTNAPSNAPTDTPSVAPTDIPSTESPVPQTEQPSTESPTAPQPTECRDNSCLMCAEIGCVFNGSIVVTGRFVIDQPTVIYGNLTNKGTVDIIVTEKTTNTLTVTGCLTAASNDSSIDVDLTGSQSSTKQVTVIKTNCFDANITVTTKECVSSNQKKTGADITVFTFPDEECDGKNRVVVIAVLVTLLLLLLIIISVLLAFCYIPMFRKWILPFNIYKREAGMTAGIVANATEL